MQKFDIDPDIRVAETLPARFYTDDLLFELSKERIFARTWQATGIASKIGSVLPTTMLAGFLDEPVVFTRMNGQLRCLSNVCTHRAKIVAEEECGATGLRCRYHGRRFDLEGRFVSMPEFDEALNFPSERDNLPRIAVETFEDLVLVSLNPLAPVSEFVGEVVSATEELYRERPEFRWEREYEVNAHWALYCENYLEGFHVPFVHESLNRSIDYGTYRTETHRYSSVQIAESRDPSLTFDGRIAAYYYFVFPNLMLNYYPWGISVNVVEPIRKDLTQVRYLTFVADESKLGAGAGADLDTVELEDQAVVESVQQGIRSRYYDRGRYSPSRERGTHHFHRLIAEFMNE